MDKGKKRRFFVRKFVITVLVCAATVICTFFVMLNVDKSNCEKSMEVDGKKLGIDILNNHHQGVYDNREGFCSSAKEMLVNYTDNKNAQLKYAALVRTVKLSDSEKSELVVSAKEAVPMVETLYYIGEHSSMEFVKYWCEEEEFIKWFKEEREKEKEDEEDLKEIYQHVPEIYFPVDYCYSLENRIDLLSAYTTDGWNFVPGLFAGDTLKSSQLQAVVEYDNGNLDFSWLAQKPSRYINEHKFRRAERFLAMYNHVFGVPSDSPVFSKINDKCESVEHKKRLGDVEVFIEGSIVPYSCIYRTFAYTNVIDENRTRYFTVLSLVGMVSLLLMVLSIVLEYWKKKNDWKQENFRRNLMNNLAHDLKTPLAVVSGYAQNLCDKVSPEKEEHYIRAIKENTDYMDSIIDNVMRLSESENRNIELETSRFDLVSLAEEIWEKNRVFSEEQRLTLKCEGSYEVEADRQLMISVLDNLLMNAIKYSKEGTAVVIIGESGGFSISNEVIKVPQRKPDELWQPFVKDDDSRGRRSGSGLGLSIVKSILDVHGYKSAISCENGIFKVWMSK